jgi:hypothetical protein
MIGRRYRAPINIGATTAQIDIFELLAGSATPLALTGFTLGQTSEVGDAQEEELLLILKYCTGSVTSGSGGTATVGIQRVLPGDSASSATLETGNTTKLAVGSGAIVELERFSWNIRQDMPVIWVPEMWQVCAGGARLVLELATTPADSISAIVGSVHFAELV